MSYDPPVQLPFLPSTGHAYLGAGTDLPGPSQHDSGGDVAVLSNGRSLAQENIRAHQAYDTVGVSIVIDTKIQKDVFRHVEAELYAYPYRKREIERLREEILAPYNERPEDTPIIKGKNSVRTPGDPTAKTAIQLAGHAKLMHLERVIDAIEEVYNRLPEPKQELIRVKYWTQPQRLTTVGICEEIGISERTYRRWRLQVITEIAEILGWR